MILSKILKLGFLISVLAMPMWSAQIALAGEEQRAPPSARTAGTLGPRVMRAITSIQELMTPEDEDVEPDLERAKEELDRLYERRFERMNDFEKQTTLSFFTNYYLTLEQFPEAIDIFEQLLLLESLREDVQLRTLRTLGQLHAVQEEWEQSIDAYQTWREVSLEEDDIVYRGLSYAHYSLEQYSEAEPYWINYMEFLLAEGDTLDRDDYNYLNGLYFVEEDYEKALELTKTMIILFNNQTDWLNLSAVYASLDDEERRIRSMNLAYLLDFIEDDTRFLNLGQSMAGLEISYSGAQIITHGMDLGAIEGDVDTFTTLAQMNLVASEYEKALAPAKQAAELDETGNGYDTYGYIHYIIHNYEAAVEAFREALDRGGLENSADTLLFLSRSLVELDDFEGASEAANEAAEAGDREDQESASNYLKFITSTKARFDVLAERRNDAIDFYQPYPPLQ
jgi:tetratricopeptide (TPR) repeat protein